MSKSPLHQRAQVMTFTFPSEVKQLDERTVQIEVSQLYDSALSQSWIDEIIRKLGERDGERFIDNATSRMNREFILAQML